MIAIFSRGQLGATFLDWSIKYLRGDNSYLSWPALRQETLIANPLLTHNAHAHKKIHPEGSDEVCKLINQYQDYQHISFEFKELGFDILAKTLDIDIQSFSLEKINLLRLAQQQDTTHALEQCVKANCDIIRIECNPAVKVFTTYDRGDGHEWLNRHNPNSNLTRQELWWQTFFSSKPHSDELWDIREHMALNIRPGHEPSLPPKSSWNFPHVTIDCIAWWFMGETILKELADFLKFSIDQSRYHTWKPIYCQWQEKLQPYVQFALQVDDIVNATVRGEYRKLPHLNLLQEAIIQHFLIYKHNLNLKNWQLSYFPDNTLELHKLLEPNSHCIAAY